MLEIKRHLQTLGVLSCPFLDAPEIALARSENGMLLKHHCIMERSVDVM